MLNNNRATTAHETPSATDLSFDVGGMHCGGCASKVERALLSVEEVVAADVSIADHAAHLGIAGDTPPDTLIDRLQAALDQIGDYSLTRRADNGQQPAPAEPSPGQAPAESLYPLFLIVGYILGVTLLIAASTGTWALESMMRHFMAGFFLVFSFFKLLDLRGFIAAYRGYDLLAKAVPPWSAAYPFVELALGVAYLLALAPVATNAVTLALMLVGAAGVLRALLRKQRIVCACLGTALNLPMTKVTLVEDLTMAAMAAAMLIIHFVS